MKRSYRIYRGVSPAPQMYRGGGLLDVLSTKNSAQNRAYQHYFSVHLSKIFALIVG